MSPPCGEGPWWTPAQVALPAGTLCSLEMPPGAGYAAMMPPGFRDSLASGPPLSCRVWMYYAEGMLHLIEISGK